MAQVFALKFGFEGQLSNVADTLIYTPPAGVISATLKTVILVNVSAVPVTVNLRARKGGGASRRVFDKDYEIPTKESRTLNMNVILNAGDSLRGDASAVASVDYTGYLAEET